MRRMAVPADDFVSLQLLIGGAAKSEMTLRNKDEDVGFSE